MRTSPLVLFLLLVAACNQSETTTAPRSAPSAVRPRLALSSLSVTQGAPLGLTACWGADGSATDVVSGNNGSLLGSVSYVPGKFGQAFSFSHQGDDVRIPPSSTLDVMQGDGMTLAAWFLPNGHSFFLVAGSGPIVEYDNGVQMWQYSQTSGSEPTTLFTNMYDNSGAGLSQILEAPTVVQGVWNHGVVTYSKTSGNITLYVDGVQRAQTHVGVIHPNTATPFNIGARRSGSFGAVDVTFDGLIDEVQLYNRELTPGEVAQIASATTTMCTTASQIAVLTQPAGAESGVPFTTQPTVQLVDASGVPVTFASATVTAAIASGPGTLSGTTTVNTVNGTATFTDLQIAGASAGTTLGFTATGLSPAASNSFPVVQVVHTMVVTSSPASASSGVTLSPAPTVELRDAANLLVSGATNGVTAAMGTGSAGALSGTLTVNAVAGVATFPNLIIAGAGSSTLSFSATGLSSVTSGTITVTATAIAIDAGNNQSATVGTVVAIAPSVIIRDASNNPIGGVTVSFAVASGGGSATGLSATTNASGIATVGSWTLGAVAGANTLTATSAGSTGSPVTFTATGTPLNVVAPPAQLGITTQPGGAETGVALAVQPVVVILDATGALVPSATNAVTVSLVSSTEAGTATLSGTTTVNAVNGVATFSGLTISKAGTYRLRFTSVGLTSVTSASFKVTRGVRQLVITKQPGGATSYEKLDSQPVVEIVDETGAKDYRATNAVTVAIATGNGTLSGTLTVNAEHGKARFTDLVVTGSGSHTLVFSAAPPTGPVSVTSEPFNVAGAPPIVWSGFFGDVDAPPKLNKVRAGRDIRLEFGLGGDEGLAIFAAGSPASQPISCTTRAILGDLVPLVMDGNSLSYNKGEERYTLRWQTSTSFDGSCRAIVLTLANGSTHTAYFNFSR